MASRVFDSPGCCGSHDRYPNKVEVWSWASSAGHRAIAIPFAADCGWANSVAM